MEKREVDFFTVEGGYYGGDQNWNRKAFLRLAGCSTTTACEACIHLARTRTSMRHLYPYDVHHITREDFRDFTEFVFPHVHPGPVGLTSIERYARMFSAYAESRGVKAEADLLPGSCRVEAARDFIRGSIADGRVTAYLMLRHRDLQFDDFVWHWFTITGYEEDQENFTLIAATFGRRHLLDLAGAWETGFTKRGGLVSLRPPDSSCPA